MTGEERELRSRSLRREVNERIAGLIEGFRDSTAGDPTMTVFCECGSEECMAPIETTLAEYCRTRRRYLQGRDSPLETSSKTVNVRQGQGLAFTPRWAHAQQTLVSEDDPCRIE